MIKSYKVKGTIRQKKAVSNIVKNGGNVVQGMKDAGYAPSSAHTPKVLTDSKGYQELYNKLGLTEDLIVGALIEDILAKPQNRTPELVLASKIKGMQKDQVVDDTARSDIDQLRKDLALSLTSSKEEGVVIDKEVLNEVKSK